MGYVVEGGSLVDGVLPVNKIVHGDALEVLKKLPDNSIDCIITSPPYWGLRDYGVEGQIGLEPTLDEYLDNILKVTEELKRVLKPMGVMFWNHGDSYGTNSGKYYPHEGELGASKARIKFNKRGYRDKCLTLQASRLAIRMIDEQGWILRNDIIWFKLNNMPESVRDRFTKTYEHVFMFTKRGKYWFDLDAVREPYKEESLKRYKYSLDNCYTPGYVYLNEKREKPQKWSLSPLGRNPGDVWIINTEPFPDAHFAVFPTKLVERCVLVGCPEQICKKCGEPRRRIIEKEYLSGGGHTNRKIAKVNNVSETSIFRTDRVPAYHTLGWTDCGCNAGWTPGIVLDPFLGSGTTALVALKLGRNFIGIELNKTYCEMAYKRTKPYLDQRALDEFFEIEVAQEVEE